jgi:hypothetical protein
MAFYKSMSRWTRKRKTDCELNQLISELDRKQSNEADFSASSVLEADIHETEALHKSDKLSSNCVDTDFDTSFESDDAIFDFSKYKQSSDSDTDNENDCDTDDIVDDLANWAVQYGISHVAITALLAVLRKTSPSLPKDGRSLLSRGSGCATVAVQSLGGGLYYHFGIENGIIHVVNEWGLSNTQPVRLHVNIDGLPLYRSTNAQFWPILGQVSNCNKSEPFVIGLFYGNSKPADLYAYLKDFVNEYKKLQVTGIFCNSMRFDIELSAVICDTPARAFVKNVKGHTGYFGCDKCLQEGEYINGRMAFPEINATLRTDASFRAKLNEDHHLGPSPLSDLSIDMISAFPLDYMHLTCLGVMRKLLYLWTRGPVSTGTRLGRQAINNLSELLVLFKDQVPFEFGRKPRSVDDLDRWKATELRQFLLYTGMVCLHGLVEEAVYNNFMLLSVSMHILLSPSLSQDYSEYAGELLRAFVKNFGEIYGLHLVSYNVHATVHLAEEAKLHGPLDNVAGFVFENHLRKLKRLIRKPHAPLQQIVRRLSERNLSVSTTAIQILQREHTAGPVPKQFMSCKQYKEYHMQSYKITNSYKDSCVLLGSNVVLVRNFISVNSEQYVVFQRFKSMMPYFTYPMDSSIFNIYNVANLQTNLEFASLADIRKKCVVLHRNEKTYVIPFVH